MKTEKNQFCIDHVECPHLSSHIPSRLLSMPAPFPCSTVSLPTQSRARTCANNTNKTKVNVKMRAENELRKHVVSLTHRIRSKPGMFWAWNRGG